jgi:hypothetical protein
MTFILSSRVPCPVAHFRIFSSKVIFQIGDKATPESVLGDLSDFSSPVYSVQCMAASMQEERKEGNKNFHLEDRNWNWKDPAYKYSATR